MKQGTLTAWRTILVLLLFLTSIHPGGSFFNVPGSRYFHRLMNNLASTTDESIEISPTPQEKTIPPVKGLSSGYTHNDVSRAKISAANKGKVPWNVGKQHSEETKQRIKEKTKESIERKKLAAAQAMGLTVAEMEAKKLEEKRESKRLKDLTKVKGITEDGRRRLAEATRKRWQDPEYRQTYVENAKGRNHSDYTKARIAESVKLKWQDAEYRTKIMTNQKAMMSNPEMRSKISQTLKARWTEPEFREKMMTRTFPRTDEWRAKVSRKIRDKWAEPDYRQAVIVGIQNSNKTFSVHRLTSSRRESEASLERRMAAERRRKDREEIKASKERDRRRRQSLKEAKALAKKARGSVVAGGAASGGLSIKDILGKELWFEEKMKRRKANEAFLDDASLEQMLQEEWAEEDLRLEEEEDGNLDSRASTLDDEEDEDDLDSDRDGEGEEDEGWEDLGDLLGDEGLDVIEVYDEDGELVGTYTAAEFDQLKRNNQQYQR